MPIVVDLECALDSDEAVRLDDLGQEVAHQLRVGSLARREDAQVGLDRAAAVRARDRGSDVLHRRIDLAGPATLRQDHTVAHDDLHAQLLEPTGGLLVEEGLKEREEAVVRMDQRQALIGVRVRDVAGHLQAERTAADNEDALGLPHGLLLSPQERDAGLLGAGRGEERARQDRAEGVDEVTEGQRAQA